jgi:hypothetical protein
LELEWLVEEILAFIQALVISESMKVVLVLLLVAGAYCHKCMHDNLPVEKSVVARQEYSEEDVDKSRRLARNAARGVTQTYGADGGLPIRINFNFEAVDNSNLDTGVCQNAGDTVAIGAGGAACTSSSTTDCTVRQGSRYFFHLAVESTFKLPKALMVVKLCVVAAF